MLAMPAALKMGGFTLMSMPCFSLTSATISPRLETDEAPWIVAMLAQPPSLVLDERAVLARLHACSIA